MRVHAEPLFRILLGGMLLALSAGCGTDSEPGGKALEAFKLKSSALSGRLPPLAKSKNLPEDLLDSKESLGVVESAFSLTASLLKRYRQLPLETDIDTLVAGEEGTAVYGEHLQAMEKGLEFLDRCFAPLADSYEALVAEPEIGVDMGLAANASAVIRLARLRLEGNLKLYNSCQEEFLDARLLYAKLLKAQNSPKAPEALAHLNRALETWTVDSPRSQEIASMAESLK